jgi:ribosomal protein S18 acetylase RimI-like enzyme
MNSTLHFTPAALADVHELSLLVNSAYRGETSKQGWTTEADLLDGIRTDEAALAELIQKRGAVILKCTTASGSILGCVFLEKQETHLYLGMLTVTPGLQAQGIGKQLLRAAELYAVQQHCSDIIMTVISVRNELIAWYQRRGYQLTGEVRPFPQDIRFGEPKQPLEFVVMRKAVTAEVAH